MEFTLHDYEEHKPNSCMCSNCKKKYWFNASSIRKMQEENNAINLVRNEIKTILSKGGIGYEVHLQRSFTEALGKSYN